MDPLEGLVATQGDHFACLLARWSFLLIRREKRRNLIKVKEDKGKVYVLILQQNKSSKCWHFFRIFNEKVASPVFPDFVD